MSDYLKKKVLNENLRTTDVYVGLHGVSGEINQQSYNRVKITFTSVNDGQTSNDVDILFPIATESWGEIKDIVIYDAVTGGNLLFKSAAEFTRTIDVSGQYKIPKNYLIVRLR